MVLAIVLLLDFCEVEDILRNNNNSLNDIQDCFYKNIPNAWNWKRKKSTPYFISTKMREMETSQRSYTMT